MLGTSTKNLIVSWELLASATLDIASMLTLANVCKYYNGSSNLEVLEKGCFLIVAVM